MYIVINKEKKETAIFKEISQLSVYINRHRNTISNNLKLSKWWELDKFTVIKADFTYLKSLRGGKR